MSKKMNYLGEVETKFALDRLRMIYGRVDYFGKDLKNDPNSMKLVDEVLKIAKLWEKK